MNRFITLVYCDIKRIIRDKTLTVFLSAPIILILFVRLFVPFITGKFPIVAKFHPIIMMFGSIQTAILFGFITSFIILEEKDENVLQVIRVLPISPFYYIAYRLLFATVISFFGALLMINLGGMAYPGFINSILLSVQYGLTAPFITLIIATYANNKVEGMAYFKGVDLVLILPILSFFIPGILKFVFAIIPAFWTYTLYQRCLVSGNVICLFIIGLIAYAVVITILFMQFKKRIFDR